jgi:hypothetical protein
MGNTSCKMTCPTFRKIKTMSEPPYVGSYFFKRAANHWSQRSAADGSSRGQGRILAFSLGVAPVSFRAFARQKLAEPLEYGQCIAWRKSFEMMLAMDDSVGSGGDAAYALTEIGEQMPPLPSPLPQRRRGGRIESLN